MPAEREPTMTEITAVVPSSASVGTWPYADPDAAPMSHLALLNKRFALQALIGRGGMGAVYRAYDIVLEEQIALKTVEGPITQREFDALRREVKLARRVTHPNVVRTFDLGVHERTPFVTMELIEGESLQALLRREGALPVSRIHPIAIAIASGLAAAHAASILHLDLKPGNVLLGKDGRVAVTDFGISRSFADAEARSTIAGTPRYMAPEVAFGGAPSARADVYALGVVLYEMHLGRRPTPDETQRIAPDVMSQQYAFIVARCLAADSTLRYASAADALEQLRRAGGTGAGTTGEIAIASAAPADSGARDRPSVRRLDVGARTSTTGPAIDSAPALERYLLGRLAYNNISPEQLREAVTHFDAARELAPDNAAIISACALARIRLQQSFGDDLMDAARELAWRARTLDPKLAEADLAVAAVNVQLAKEADAMAPLARTLQRAPWLPDGHALLGQILAEIGETERGVQELETALAFDPLITTARTTLAHVRALQGDAKACDDLLDFNSTNIENYGSFAWRRLRAIIYDPRPERLERLRAEMGSRDFPLRFIVDAGMTVVEQRIVPDVLEAAFSTMAAPSSAPRRTTMWSTIVVDVLAYTRQYDEALVLLENADRYGLLDVAWLERSPTLAPLRDRNEYRAVLGHVRARALEVTEVARSVGIL